MPTVNYCVFGYSIILEICHWASEPHMVWKGKNYPSQVSNSFHIIHRKTHPNKSCISYLIGSGNMQFCHLGLNFLQYLLSISIIKTTVSHKMIRNVLRSSWGIVTGALQCYGCIHGNWWGNVQSWWNTVVKAQQQNYSMKTYLDAEFCFSSCRLFKQSIARGKNRQSCTSKFLLNIQGGQRWQGLRVKLEEPSFIRFKYKHSQHTIFLFNLLMMDVLTFDIPLKKSLSSSTELEDEVCLPITH